MFKEPALNTEALDMNGGKENDAEGDFKSFEDLIEQYKRINNLEEIQKGYLEFARNRYNLLTDNLAGNAGHIKEKVFALLNEKLGDKSERAVSTDTIDWTAEPEGIISQLAGTITGGDIDEDLLASLVGQFKVFAGKAQNKVTQDALASKIKRVIDNWERANRQKSQ